MILSLDANVLIDLVNGRRQGVRGRFDEAVSAGQRLMTCALAAHELLYGASISGRPQAQVRSAQALLRHLEVAEFSSEDANAAVTVRMALRAAGRSIGNFDTLIAGQALSRQWTMVTANVREFARVPGLRVIDWTNPAENP